MCIACAASTLDGSSVTLERKESSSIPIEADSICPERFMGLSQAEIAALPAFYGRRQVTLGDLFVVEGAGADSITVKGDVRAVKKIGRGMSWGRITVDGDVGAHLGAEMSGGEIVVHGNAGDWVGAHMAGGRIVVEGSAGHSVGGAYMGATHGMTGGTIIVRGSAGREAGSRMRRGLIVIFGDVGEFAGVNMLAGSLFVWGQMGKRAGAGMKRGSIVALGTATEVLPTFRYVCTYSPVFLRYYLRRLRSWELIDDDEWALGLAAFRRYIGDRNSGGRGEILVRVQA
jgi:formylmethanofuran dehydrogenase subunit C